MHCNGEHLTETLAALRAWYEERRDRQAYQHRELHDRLLAAAERLFAEPKPTPSCAVPECGLPGSETVSYISGRPAVPVCPIHARWLGRPSELPAGDSREREALAILVDYWEALHGRSSLIHQGQAASWLQRRCGELLPTPPSAPREPMATDGIEAH